MPHYMLCVQIYSALELLPCTYSTRQRGHAAPHKLFRLQALTYSSIVYMGPNPESHHSTQWKVSSAEPWALDGYTIHTAIL